MPNSVLWICLVAIWLFVLVPMLIKGRPEVRKPTQATLATRVIDRGGKAMSRATRRIAAGRHPHDADWVAPEREFRKAGDLINDDDDHADARRERVTARTATAVAEDPESDVVDDQAQDGSDRSDGPVVDLDAIHVRTSPADRDPATTASSPATDTAAGVDDVEVEVDRTDAEADTDDDLSGDDMSEASEDLDLAGEDDARPIDETDDVDEDHDLDDEYEVDEPARRGRGGYDPDADTRRSERRYRVRQRMVLLLATLSLAGLGVGIAMGGIAWAATGVTVGLLVLYMAFLRRAVRIEEQIRRRRVSRATRPPRRREFDDVGDPLADEIPFHLRRPGAVVLEIDDEHPVFEHLPPFQHRRMMREEPEYRRAVGQ
jgi:hypothetical protein